MLFVLEHLNGAKHKKKKYNLGKREAREAAQKSAETAEQQESDPESVSKACSS